MTAYSGGYTELQLEKTLKRRYHAYIVWYQRW